MLAGAEGPRVPGAESNCGADTNPVQHDAQPHAQTLNPSSTIMAFGPTFLRKRTDESLP